MSYHIPPRPTRKLTRCSCGEAWAVLRTTLKDGTHVDGYWCHLCDGRAVGDKLRPQDTPNA